MSHDLKRTKCQENRLKFPDPLSLVEGRGLGTRLLIHAVRTGLTSLVPRPLPPGKGSGDFRRISLVQQNGGVLECERANQIAEFKFSEITTRNDHVTA